MDAQWDGRRACRSSENPVALWHSEDLGVQREGKSEGHLVRAGGPLPWRGSLRGSPLIRKGSHTRGDTPSPAILGLFVQIPTLQPVMRFGTGVVEGTPGERRQEELKCDKTSQFCDRTHYDVTLLSLEITLRHTSIHSLNHSPPAALRRTSSSHDPLNPIYSHWFPLSLAEPA